MYKELITYENLNGDTITEEFCFHLSKADVLKMEMSLEGGVEGYIEGLISANDRAGITEFITNFIEKSYGVKTPDGGFDRSPEVLRRFVQSEAYSELFSDLVTDADHAARFINGIMPKQIDKTDSSKNQNIITIENAKKEAAERLNKAREEAK